MSARPNPLLLLALLVGAALALWLALAPGPERGRGGESLAEPAAPTAGRAEAPPEDLAAPPSTPSLPEGPVATTVLWPLRVALELEQALHLPSERGVQPVGSGRSARLSGRVVGADGEGVAAEIAFAEGPNRGRVLHADASGAFGATDLLPGLSIVEVRGPGILGSRRLVRLRQGRDQLLNLGYGRPGAVLGRVVDPEGEGVAGAGVTVDGTTVRTDLNGDFQLAVVAAGEVLVEVEKEGFAHHQRLLAVAGGSRVLRENLTIPLEREAALLISVANNVGGPGPVKVMLLPGNFDQRTASGGGSFPWHRVGAVDVFPGTPARIGGLPTEVVRVHAFRPGAQALQRVANLRSEGELPLELHLEPAPRLSGVVTLDGETVAGAHVRLEAPNVVRATLSYFREPSWFLETAVLPLLPAVSQEVETDGGGRFVLTAWSDLVPVRYLEARGPGRTWAGRLVHPEDEHVEVALEPADFGAARLTLELPPRHQGLPVELSVDGAPLEPFVLEPRRPLEVEGLLPGLWRVRASWNGEVLLEESGVRIEERAALTCPLPEGAVLGQDEQTWRRSGREPN